MVYIQESEQRGQELALMRMELNKRNHGVGSVEEAFAAEMRDTARIAGMLSADIY